MEREKLVEYIEMHFSTREIAEAEGISQGKVMRLLKRHSLKTKSKHFLEYKPGKKCANCDNTVQGNSYTYCRECIDKGVHRRGYGTPVEQYRTDRHRKMKLLQDRGHRCENCGLTEWIGHPITLELHHVDGDADNNNRENLQLLCLNCHSLSPTFRAKNKVTGTNRRKIYRKKYYES